MVILSLLVFACRKDFRKTNNISNPEYTEINVVPEDIAKLVAEGFNPKKFFFAHKASNGRHKNPAYKIMLDGNNQIKNHLTFKDSSGYPAFYIFNYEDNAGFLIVSADYNISPILAYVPHGSFERDTVPAGLVMWVDRTLENTEIVRKGLYDNSKLAHAAWNHYFNLNNIQSSNSTIGRIIPPPSCVDSSHTTTVGPLVPVT